MNCDEHHEMHADIIYTKTTVGILLVQVKDLYDKRDELGEKIDTNNIKLMEKLSAFELHFATKEGVKDRLTLDKINKAAIFACKVFFFSAAGVLGGGSVYIAVAAAIAKFL